MCYNFQYMPDRLRKAIANMDASFRSLVEAASIQAASVGLVYDQELIWQQGYGLVDSSDPSSYDHRCHTTTPATDRSHNVVVVVVGDQVSR
jgi:hypothetical protein